MYNGLILGILGGMGPAATAEFLKLLAEKAPASCDQEHPRMFLYSFPQIPNRTDYLVGTGANPAPALKDGLTKLLSWGADLLAVPCNTSHYYIDTFPDEIKSKIVSIVDETINQCKEKSPEGAWLTATLGTMNMGIYQKKAKEKGYDFFVPNEEEQEKIHYVTDLVKAGDMVLAGKIYNEVCKGLLRRSDIPITCACTELPIAYNFSGLPQDKCISSLEALAIGCLRELYN